MATARRDGQIRLAELMAALSLATDLGLGRPLEYELGVCLSALELADRLGCSSEERSDVYYLALLIHLGCTAAATILRAGSAATRSTSTVVRRFSARFLSPRRL